MDGLFNQGSMPVLERLAQFTGRRQRVIADNIANLSTPGYRTTDLDPAAFQATLRRAIDERRASGQAAARPFMPADTQQVKFTPDNLEVAPAPSRDGILFHDRNDRDLDRMMQRLAENTMTHNMAIELLRNQFSILRTAISQRV